MENQSVFVMFEIGRPMPSSARQMEVHRLLGSGFLEPVYQAAQPIAFKSVISVVQPS
jgi:hypothetical protein